MGDGLFSSRDCVMLVFVYFRLFANRRSGVAIFRDKVFQMSSLFFGSDLWPEKKVLYYKLLLTSRSMKNESFQQHAVFL